MSTFYKDVKKRAMGAEEIIFHNIKALSLAPIVRFIINSSTIDSIVLYDSS